MKPTQKEKDKAIQKLAKLKKGLPRKSMFGDDNHALIDAQTELIINGGDYEKIAYKFRLDEMQESELFSTNEWLNGKVKTKDFFESLEL